MDYASKLFDHLFEIKRSRRPNRRKLRRKERRLQKKIQAEFEKHKKEILKTAKKILAKSKKSPLIFEKYKAFYIKSAEEEIDALFKKLDFDNMIEFILEDSGETMKMGADYQINKNKLGSLGISFDLDHDLAVDYLKRARPLILAKLPETTKKKIKPILVEAVKTGQSYTDTAKIISDNFAVSPTRALMISVNETRSAYEVGNIAPMLDANELEGVESVKYWQTSEDNDVTPECENNQYNGFSNDDWIGVEEPFPSGDLIAPRINHPRCRCYCLHEARITK